MKKPEPSPDWLDILRQDSQTIFQLASKKEVSKIIQKANSEYLYWDHFKYLEIPQKMRPEHLWTYLKMTRNTQIKRLDFIRNNDDKAFGYWLPDSVQKLLHDIDRFAGGQLTTDELYFSKKEGDRYLIESIMEEAIASSQLEGAVATRKVAKEMLITGRKPRDGAEQMILNNYNTILKIKDYKNTPVTAKTLCYFHELITKDTLDSVDEVGRFRKQGEEVDVVDKSDNTILHNGIKSIDLMKHVDRFLNFANNDSEDVFIHPIIKGIILHFWLAYIHPFNDGNGRVARTIFYWYLLKKNYWLCEFLSISRIILKAPKQYNYAYLYSECDGRDLTYFILFNLKIIRVAINELLSYIRKKKNEIQKSTELLSVYPGLNIRQQSIIYHSLINPDSIYTITAYQKINKVVYQTARTDLMDLCDKGLFKKIERNNKYFFSPVEHLDSKLKISQEQK